MPRHIARMSVLAFSTIGLFTWAFAQSTSMGIVRLPQDEGPKLI